MYVCSTRHETHTCHAALIAASHTAMKSNNLSSATAAMRERGGRLLLVMLRRFVVQTRNKLWTEKLLLIVPMHRMFRRPYTFFLFFVLKNLMRKWLFSLLFVL